LIAVRFSALQTFLQQFGHHLVQPDLALLRQRLNPLHQIAVALDRERYQAERLVELALLAPVRH